jgi:hypothetical protein
MIRLRLGRVGTVIEDCENSHRKAKAMAERHPTYLGGHSIIRADPSASAAATEAAADKGIADQEHEKLAELERQKRPEKIEKARGKQSTGYLRKN